MGLLQALVMAVTMVAVVMSWRLTFELEAHEEAAAAAGHHDQGELLTLA